MDHSTRLSNHKLGIARTFNRAALTYSNASFLEKELGLRLLDRLNYIKFTPASILDLGGGAGFFTKMLLNQYAHSVVYNLDLAEQLLVQAQHFTQIYRLCADAEHLPLRKHSVDFVFSNAVIHWLEETKNVFAEIQRILKPGGLFLFSMLGPDTLQELKASFLLIDAEQHINYFADMHLIGDALLEAGFHDPVVDRETLTITYPNTSKLLKDLKSSGSSYVLRAHSPKFSQKTLFQKLSTAYEKFRDETGSLPVTVEILYGHAWIPSEPHLYPVSVCR